MFTDWSVSMTWLAVWLPMPSHDWAIAGACLVGGRLGDLAVVADGVGDRHRVVRGLLQGVARGQLLVEVGDRRLLALEVARELVGQRACR